MTSQSASSSPDPIILPSSPPSAHSTRRLDADTHYESSRSPTRPQRRPRSPQSMMDTAQEIAQSEAREARAQRRLARQRDRQARALTNESYARADVEYPRKRRRQQTPRHESEDLPTKQRARIRNDQSVDPRILISRNHAASVQPLSPSDDGGESDGAAYTGDIPGIYPQDHMGESTMANEDFTMISVPSLAGIKANNSILSVHDEVQDSVRDARLYPDVTRLTPRAIAATREVHQSISRDVRPSRDYDAMSWQPTGPLKLAQQDIKQVEDGIENDEREDDEQQSIDVQNNSEVDVRLQDLTNDDIWAQEASRSLQEDASIVHAQVYGSNFVPPIFSDEPQPPPRSKIPSTWRKSSGIDLSYSDSPRNAAESREVTKRAQDPAIRDNSVITPPGTDDAEQEELASEESDNDADDADEDHEQHDDVEEEDDDDGEELADQYSEATDEELVNEESDLTHPDAVGTELQDVENAVSINKRSSPYRREESGLYWQQNTPGFLDRPPRRPRQSIHDPENVFSGDVVGIVMGTSPAVARLTPLPHNSRARSKLVIVQSVGKEISAQLGSSPSHRQELLSSSPARARGTRRPESQYSSINTAQRPQQSQSWEETPIDHISLRQDSEVTDGTETDEPEPSYQEHLNVHSPRKVQIAFNDSSNISMTDRLKPSRQYPPLFDGDTTAETPPPAHDALMTSTKKRAKTEPIAIPKGHIKHNRLQLIHPSSRLSLLPSNTEPGLVARVLGSIWSAIIRPTGPIYIDPLLDESSQLSFQQDDDPIFPPSLRAKLRSRYGVLADQHPWTMTHMRTLHRMLNSLIEAQADSIIPTALPLSPYFTKLIGKQQETAMVAEYIFKFQHACAINAFMQILVPVNLVRAMERGEVEWLGDDIAGSYRGLLGGRLGNELCFKTIKTPEGSIDREWLVACMGCIVHAKEDLGRGVSC